MLRWPGKETAQLPAFTDTLLGGENGDVLALSTSLGALCHPERRRSGGGWPRCRRMRQIVAWTLGDRGRQSAADRHVSLPKASRERVPPAATSAQPTPPLFRGAPIAAAPRPRARPATSSVGLAPCGRGSAAWCVKLTPSPSARRTTSTPSTFLSLLTISPSNSEQHTVDHYP